MLAGALLILNSASASAAETVYYLGGLNQTTFPTLPNDPTYGQVDLAACRTGWRFIQPSPCTGAACTWTSIDNCEAAVQSIPGAKWSLSIKIGADVPLWLFTSACTASAPSGSGESLPGSAGSSSVLAPFQVSWPTSFEYTMGSTQCLPVPWDSNFQTDLKTFIQAVYSHIHNNYPSYLPDHVVVTGINYTTQENLQPNCTTSGCGYGGNSDVDNWVTLMVAEHKCTNYSTCQSAYNGLLEGAYTNIIDYWGGNFPSSVGLASMFVNSGVASFPFNTSTTLGLDLLNKVVSYSSSRSIVMNNAAQNGTNGLVNPIRCYAGTQDSGFTCQSPQPTSTIAFQELQAVVSMGNCSPLTTLLTTASGDASAFMETYPNDISSCL